MNRLSALMLMNETLSAEHVLGGVERLSGTGTRESFPDLWRPVRRGT